MSFASQEQVDTISALTSQLYRYYSTAYYEGVYSGKLDKAIEHDLIPWLLEFKKEVVAAGCNLDSMGVYFRNDRPVLQYGTTVVCSYDAMDNATMRKLRLPLTDVKLVRKEVEADLYQMIMDLKSGMTVEQFAEKYRGNDIYHGVPELEQHILEQVSSGNSNDVTLNARIANGKSVSAIGANLQSDLAVAKFLSQNNLVRVGYNNGKIVLGDSVIDRYAIRIRCVKNDPDASVKRDPLKIKCFEVDLKFANGNRSLMKFRPSDSPFYVPRIEKVLNENAIGKEQKQRGR